MCITIINGDLLDATENIIGHQVNCKGVMGAGVAKLIKQQYTDAFESYIRTCRLPIDEILGSCQIVRVGQDKFIANLFGQKDFGRSAKQYTDYEALKTALQSLKEQAKANQLSVALPFNIGCGLANGDWKVVEEIINEVFSDYHVSLYKI
ncbi:macro domain-containing protein [Brevibacillus laterosporus]|uniref:Appr-1-p processing protein n=1 Tax=Brevibacillus laterosporus TaxID=1465 RepID=A0AAP8QGP0_BRELA|nr:macro domain-containing protein [Brevibacillus laterosporus]PPB12881.1 Appr-1-p processing protein [Brevibacillus laterosporus]